MIVSFAIETITTQGIAEKDYNVITTIQFEAKEANIKEQVKADIIEQYREMFEIETLSAVVTDKDLTTEIKINTKDTEKIEWIRNNMRSVIRRQTMPPINPN